MSRLLATCLTFSAILSFSIPGSARAQTRRADPAGLELTVRLYDYAQVPAGGLAKARSEAARVLRGAGVNTLWLGCPLSAAEAEQNTDCRRSLTPSDLVLRILPASMVPHWGRDTALFGYALPPQKGGLGVLANVFFHRVEELGREIRTLPAGRVFSPPVILGHLMAHEIGHLLLGSDSHSRRGIMSFPWSRKQLEQTTRGDLRFTSQQVRRIRANVLRRVAGE